MNNIRKVTEEYAANCVSKMLCVGCEHYNEKINLTFDDVPAVIACYNNYILNNYYVIDINKLQYLDVNDMANLYIEMSKRELVNRGSTHSFIRRYMECILSREYLVIRNK